MADKKKGSSFDVPSYGHVEKIPDGYVAKKDKDGVVHYVKARKDSKKKDK